MARVPNWRIWLGLGLTGAWLLLGTIYVSRVIGWGSFAFIPADQLGTFLEGAFAPLAFLCLVIGYFRPARRGSWPTPRSPAHTSTS